MAFTPPSSSMRATVSSSMYVTQSQRIFPLGLQRRNARCPMATWGWVKMEMTPEWNGSLRKTLVYFLLCWRSRRVVQVCLGGGPALDIVQLGIVHVSGRSTHPSGGTYWRGSSQMGHDTMQRVSYWTPHMPQIIRSILSFGRFVSFRGAWSGYKHAATPVT